MAHWNPQQYLKFSEDRLRPALDLLGQVPLEKASRVVDLGCGPGNVTALLHQRWPDAHIIGVDNSSDMLAKAQASFKNIVWQQDDVAGWESQQGVDLIFSNACLHWLSDHKKLFLNLMQNLNSGGVLAVQMPNNFAQPTHQLIRDSLEDVKRGELAPGFPVHQPAFYYDVLSSKCRSLNIWETTYMHVLEGDDPIYNWTKGAALRPILEGLKGETEVRDFEESYISALRQAYPKRGDGKTVMAFKRFFLIGQKL